MSESGYKLVCGYDRDKFQTACAQAIADGYTPAAGFTARTLWTYCQAFYRPAGASAHDEKLLQLATAMDKEFSALILTGCGADATTVLRCVSALQDFRDYDAYLHADCARDATEGDKE